MTRVTRTIWKRVKTGSPGSLTTKTCVNPLLTFERILCCIFLLNSPYNTSWFNELALICLNEVTAKLELHSNFICWWHVHAVVRSVVMDQLVFYPNFFYPWKYHMISINLMDKCKLSGLDIFNYFSYFIFRVWWLAALATLILFCADFELIYSHFISFSRE